MKPYRLLRNNKETGPYSAEDLIAMGLKAYDLVWVDGKSAAWRYPCEIPALKAYAPEAEDLAATFWKPNAQQKQALVPAPARVEKPRFRVRADWRKIDDRTQMTDDRNTMPVPTPTVATPAVTREVPVPAVQPMQEEDKATPQVKYTESLDSIKQRYNDTVLRRNGTALPAVGRYGWLLLLVPALGLGMWIGNGWHKEKPAVVAEKTPAPEQQVAAVSLQDAMVAEEPATEPGTTPDPVPVATAVGKSPEKPQVVPAAVPAKQLAPTTTIAAVGKKPVQKPVVKVTTPVVAINGQKNNPARSTVAVPTAKPTSTTTVAAAKPTTPVVQQTEKVKSTPAPAPVTATTGKKIADYVSVKEELQQFEDGKQMKLHVQNNTSTPVDLVVLDLQYYDGNGKFKKGETLYVNHLSANNVVALTAPSVKNAQRIDYKVSLLSIEKNGVYLIAE